jgi:FMN-dependent NADH-azoreductase
VLGGPKDGLNAVQQAELERTEQFLAEFMAADVLVIGARSTTSASRASSRPGSTASRRPAAPSATPPTARKAWPPASAIVVSSRGGVRQDANALDLHEITIDAVLRFLGITDITFVRAHGLAMGPEAREAGLTTARTQIAALNDAGRAPPPEPDRLAVSV